LFKPESKTPRSDLQSALHSEAESLKSRKRRAASAVSPVDPLTAELTKSADLTKEVVDNNNLSLSQTDRNSVKLSEITNREDLIKLQLADEKLVKLFNQALTELYPVAKSYYFVSNGLLMHHVKEIQSDCVTSQVMEKSFILSTRYSCCRSFVLC
jgi:hypothetical protein